MEPQGRFTTGAWRGMITAVIIFLVILLLIALWSEREEAAVLPQGGESQGQSVVP